MRLDVVGVRITPLDMVEVHGKVGLIQRLVKAQILAGLCDVVDSVVEGIHAVLIDFNARFYNQVGLEIARGLDIPGLVYAAATGQDEKVDDLIAAFEKREKGQNYAFCNSFQFQLITRFRRGLGSMSPDTTAALMPYSISAIVVFVFGPVAYGRVALGRQRRKPFVFVRFSALSDAGVCRA